jgi:hypothetical protein
MFPFPRSRFVLMDGTPAQQATCNFECYGELSVINVTGNQILVSLWTLVRIAWPITVAAWSKVCTVFAGSTAGIVGSNPTQCMDVCVSLFCVCVVLCVGNGLATGSSPG